ncbi:hypothetical protein WME89_05125 [Sorangium sp. So ce321]|uniref:hypothetical protein n=1 Tax=Sorangium sp. So ce321 TaxID=3133300 RepID=UPI003F5E14DC
MVTRAIAEAMNAAPEGVFVGESASTWTTLSPAGAAAAGGGDPSCDLRAILER